VGKFDYDKADAGVGNLGVDVAQASFFANIEEAKQFVFDLDGSCGFDYRTDRQSFQKIDYPPRDMYFCHECRYDFPLIDYLCEQAESDCVLFMRDMKQTRGSS
jgi:hypothetical protein